MKPIRLSLASRVSIPLVVLQFVVPILTTVIWVIFWPSPGDEYAVSQFRVSHLVASALVDGSDGRPAITATPALKRFQNARPEVRIAIIDRQGNAVEGSDPDLVAALQRYGYLTFFDALFIFPDNLDSPLAGSVVVATSGTKPYSESTLFVADNRVRASDIPTFIRLLATQVIEKLGPFLLVVVLAVPFFVRRALRPLVAASREAAAIDLRSREKRLPDGPGVPSELLPLVQGINAALDRLDQGVSRQQRFSAQAAHEMRTPLAILAARIDSLKDVQAGVGLRRNVERMRTLVDQLLFVARLERLDLPLDEAIDLVALARDVVADCAPLAIAEGRQLALVPEVARLTMRGNSHALASAIVNLAENALRAEPPGGTVEIVIQHRDMARVLVVDHGPGIAPANREQIFEPFWRREERVPGAGLGLAIVKEVAAAHGGSITVDETPGGGATFCLSLRRAGSGLTSVCESKVCERTAIHFRFGV
ncbi:HAMP domain-containing sensor histidine kinase [Alkalilimnicola ehrlichii]|nr:HAMP domain-containing sensor histidine kinase [Alkalilimnicola ehrlichii]